MSELTDEKLKLVALAIQAKRLRGEIPADAPLSTKRMAKISEEIGHPVSEATFRRIENRGLERLRLASLALQTHAGKQP